MRKRVSVCIGIAAIVILFTMFPPGPYFTNWSDPIASVSEPIFGAKVEAKAIETPTPERLQFQSKGSFIGTEVVVVCDTATGNLLYITDGFYSGGITSVPNGCAKPPR